MQIMDIYYHLKKIMGKVLVEILEEQEEIGY